MTAIKNTTAYLEAQQTFFTEKDLAKKISAIVRLIKLANEAENEEVVEMKPRVDTSGYYSLRGVTEKRQVLNNRAYEILNRIEQEGIPSGGISDEEKQILAMYSGCGGNMKDRKGNRGSAYEYYTPKPIAEGIWDVVKSLGFGGGRVLDPCSGTGIFGATAPLNCAIEAVELSKDSGMINKLLNDGVGYTTHAGTPFEQFAVNTEDETFDAVVSNVPFGTRAARGANASIDPRYSKEDLSYYFLMRSMEKLKPGGMAAFIVPMKCVSGKGGKDIELRQKLSYIADFIGAYRLPSGTFSQADTDVATDVMFFRKFKEDVIETVENLRTSSPETLVEAKVCWDDFIEGRYFDTGEGRPYQLGEFVPKDPDDKFSRDRVVYTGGNILLDFKDLIKKKPLPKSRIDWKLLDAVETTPVSYKDGDHIQSGGQTLVMRDGIWMLESVDTKDNEPAEVSKNLQLMQSPYALFDSGMTFKETADALTQILHCGRTGEIPAWITALSNSMKAMDVTSDAAEDVWEKAVCAMAVSWVLQERSGQRGVNFKEEYPELSDAMASLNPGAETDNWRGEMREAARVCRLHYTSKNGFSNVWTGNINADVAQSEAVREANLDPAAAYARMRYRTKSEWSTIESVKAIYGENFDPYESNEWCVSADGKMVAMAGDYYVGEYDKLVFEIEKQIKNATDERLRDKLVRQRLECEKRVRRVDPKKMSFTLTNPLITAEEKVEFLKQYVHDSAFVDMSGGKPVADISISGAKTLDEKLFNRIGKYVKYGSLSLGLRIDDEKERIAAVDRLKFLAQQYDQQFDAWCHANPDIMNRLNKTLNGGKALRFMDPEDEVSFAIPGMNPSLKLHGYQAAYVRKMGRDFCGINGFGVGLGKTFTALAAVQHVQAIGAKRKTLFVVPNAVLSNWKKEAGRAFTSLDDCLFVGLRATKNGESVKSSEYDADLLKIRENKHSKIFVTMEAFERIKLTDDTIDKYLQFMQRMNPDLAFTDSNKDNIEKESKLEAIRASLKNKKGAAPYLEDLGIDSVVMDEAHAYKNSTNAKFKAAKYLSLSPASSRGFDAQAKNWFIRGANEKGDGVLMLTATPLTNSPLEIYSMLSLAVGEERVAELCGGAKGGSEFLKEFTMCDQETGQDIAGQPNVQEVFSGLTCVETLQRAVGDIVTIKTAKDVGAKVVIPDREEISSHISLSTNTLRIIDQYRGAYIFAKLKKDDVELLSFSNPEYLQKIKGDFEALSKRTGEPQNIIGHPFNLISKMNAAIVDSELTRNVSVYLFDEGKADVAKKAAEAFNKLKIKEDRNYRSEDMVDGSFTTKSIKAVSDDGEEVTKRTLYVVTVKATVLNGRIEINSSSPKAQDALEEICDKLGLDLDVNDSEKLAALIENVKNEQATPRGINSDGEKTKLVKQIIFCDVLPLHNKIKRLLTKRCGMPSGKIAIITGQKNNDADAILGVQEGFNADGEENKYQIIIANEKAEVGINLQKGTQAIHHFTIGWTPDSIEQRNGRGARQGNKTAKVTIYYYDADGTFDEMKRTMVGKKSDWIEEVVSGSGNGNVAISGGLSDEEYDSLIRSCGDKEAFDKLMREKEEREERARKAAKINRQKMVVNTIIKQSEYIAKSSDQSRVLDSTMTDALFEYRKYKEAVRTKKSDKIVSSLRKNAERLQEYCDKNIVIRPWYENSISYPRFEEPGEPISFAKAYSKFVEGNPGAKTKRGISDYVVGKLDLSYHPSSNEAKRLKERVETAERVMSQSEKEFNETGAVEGGLPPDFIKQWKRGKARVVNGMYLMDYAFIRLPNGGLSYITEGVGRHDISGKGSGWLARPVNAKGDYWHCQKFPFNDSDPKLMSDMIVLPGMQGYQQCLKIAAEEEKAKSSYASGLSDKIPEMKKYLGNTGSVDYPAYTTLPPPYFPYAISNRYAKLSKFLMSIQVKQREIVEDFPLNDMGGFFTAKKALDTCSIGSPSDLAFALYKYAESKGEKVPILAFAGESSQHLLTMIDFASIVKAGSKEDIYNAFKNAFIDSLPHVDFSGFDLDKMVNRLLEYDREYVKLALNRRIEWACEGYNDNDYVPIDASDSVWSIREYLTDDQKSIKLKDLKKWAAGWQSKFKLFKFGKEVK